MINSTNPYTDYSAILEDQEYFRRLHSQKNFPPCYYCICSRSHQLWGWDCHCSGSGKLTADQAIKVYGFIPYYREIPYCHICLNQIGCELFPYAVVDFGWDINIDNTGRRGHLCNQKFIYRCRMGHGHDAGLSFVDILTGFPVHIPIGGRVNGD